MKSKTTVVVIVFLSILLLIPGLLFPIFEITMDTSVNASIANFSMKVLNDQRSIFGTVEELYKKEFYFVGSMIFFFSVVIPFFKGLMILIITLSEKNKLRMFLRKWTLRISKWSMADVFVVAIFLAFLATNENGISHNSEINVMGMKIPLAVNSIMKANLGIGFYFFLSYCILSIWMTRFIKLNEIKEI